MLLWVPTDCAGPLGAFASEGAARAAVEPYRRAGWRGALFRHQTAEPVRDGEEVTFLLPCDASVPVFVAGTAEARRVHAAIADAGLVEPAEDLGCRRAALGELIPAAKKRLDPLFQCAEGGDPNAAAAGEGAAARQQAALNLLERLIESDSALASQFDALDTEPNGLSVADFVVNAPRALADEQTADADGQAASASAGTSPPSPSPSQSSSQSSSSSPSPSESSESLESLPDSDDSLSVPGGAAASGS